jgi:AAA+ ATPase superfamily predicted ATPase
MKTPFKFLDAYQKEDIGFYFGRENDTEILYEMVNKSRIVLVYGPSGTGKTSLIKCGLDNKFNPTDWIPFYIRRKDDINRSLIEKLIESLEEHPKPLPGNAELQQIAKTLFVTRNASAMHQAFCADIGITFSKEEIESTHTDTPELPTHIRMGVATLVYYLVKISKQVLRPVYLVFDQLEELLIDGSTDEKTLFIESLKAITATQKLTSCHVIISMREEFFALFDKFEKELEGITNRRMRVEPMQKNDVKRVLRKTLTYPDFNIKLEDASRNIDDIYNVLADSKGNVSLPYLQVYIDQLWREDYVRTYGEQGYKGEGFAPLTFTTQEIHDFGEIQDVLQKFLTGRKLKIADKLKRRYPKSDPEFMDKVLKELVSDQGTKLSIPYEMDGEKFVFPDANRKYFQGFDPQHLHFTLDKLEKHNVIRKETKTLELSHDVLAKVIDEQRNSTERKRIRIRLIIREYLKEADPSLTLTEVREWESEIENCGLTETELEFFHKWKTVRIQEESEMQWKKKISKRRFRTMVWLLAGAAVFAATIFFFFWKTRQISNRYYALHFIGTSSHKIPNKLDALKLSYYVYNKSSDLDPSHIQDIQAQMLQLATDTALQGVDAIQNLKLLSDHQFVPGINMDVSESGKFFCVEFDTKKSALTPKKFRLYRTGDKEPFRQFENVYYAYFLNNSDTLLLAVSNRALANVGYPNSFYLFDCNKEEFLNNNARILLPGQGGLSYLPSASALPYDKYSEFDSYDIRRTASGNLMVPFRDYSRTSYYAMVGFLGNNFNPLPAAFNTNLSISSARNNKLFLIGAYIDNQNELNIVNEFGEKVGPEFIDVRWCDFTENNSICLLSNDTMYLVNGPGQPNEFETRHTIRTPYDNFQYAYCVADETMLVIKTITDEINLKSFTDPRLNINYREKLTGISYRENYMISVPYEDTTGVLLLDSVIIKRDFQNRDNPVTVRLPQRIVKTAYNEKTGRILVETTKNAQTGAAYLYLYDNMLSKKGGFVISPNDSYAFSNDGNTLLLIRDDKLSVYDLQKGSLMDYSDFNSILSWLGKNTNQTEINSLRKKHRVDFPNVFK